MVTLAVATELFHLTSLAHGRGKGIANRVTRRKSPRLAWVNSIGVEPKRRVRLRQQRIKTTRLSCSPPNQQGKGEGEGEGEGVQTREKVGEREEEISLDQAESVAQTLANLVANPASYLVAAVVVAGLTSQLKPNALTVVLLSALPVVGLTAISKTKVGEGIANKVEQEKKDLLPLASARELERVRLKKSSRHEKYFGSGRRKLFFLGSNAIPQHLDGTLPGDAGFDLFGLSREENGGGGGGSGALASTNPSGEKEEREQVVELDENWRDGAYAGTKLGKLFEAELLHGRWAMLAAIGCLIPEALSRYFGFDSIAEPIWWKVGYSVLHDGVEINYAGLPGFRIAGDKGVLAIAACQLVLMGGPEYARRVGIESLEPVGIFLPGDVNYPGGQLFDPLNLAEDPDAFLEQQVKEIKNGRLAMLAMLGYAAQAIVTKKGPLENLEDSLSWFFTSK